MDNALLLGPGEGKVINLPSATLVLKNSQPHQDPGRIFGELTAEPGFVGPGAHSHATQHESFFVLDGEFLFTVEGEEIRLTPGMTISIPPNTQHNFANVGTERARLLVLGASEELALYQK